MAYTQTNIIWEKAVDVSEADYEDAQGFFVRAGVAGNLKYLPVGMPDDASAITKAVDASAYFNDPVQMRKIFSDGTTATSVYIGKGV